MSKDDAFDPFHLDDDEEDYDPSYYASSTDTHTVSILPFQGKQRQPQQQQQQQQQQERRGRKVVNDNDLLFEKDALASLPTGDSGSLSNSPTKSNLLLANQNNMNTSIDSDIYSHLFASPFKTMTPRKDDPRKEKIRIPSAAVKQTHASSPLDGLPVVMTLHEQMSVVYDSVPNSSPAMNIQGTINIIPDVAIGGKTFYISLQDSERHVKQVTSFFDIAKEVTDHLKEAENPFVKRHQEEGNRIFKVSMPQNVECLGTKPVNVIKYVGSDYLRPIPLLVSVKVRVVGDVCRVGVKVRSNPIQEHKLQDFVILIAVPPDASGESTKMSSPGGVWDPIKRVIVYQYEKIDCGETVDLQLQFDYLPCMRKDGQNAILPRFPVLVRCHSWKESLSHLQVDVGGRCMDDGKKAFQVQLNKSFQLFHRKI